MTNHLNLIFFSLFICCIPLIISIEKKEITFKSTSPPPYLELNKEDTYMIKASFAKTKKYLYIGPEFEDDNSGVFRIYFKKYEESDSAPNLLTSEYYTIEVSSGLYIESEKLNYNTATIFIVCYGKVHLYMIFQLTDEISAPKSTRISQFYLPKSSSMNFIYNIKGEGNVVLSIISKFSLRNINIKATINNKDNEDITFKEGGYLYPNGYSLYLDDDIYTSGIVTFKLENKNKARNEIIILGLTQFSENSIFPNQIVNGFQLYLDRVYTNLWYLKNSLASPFYYTYQLYGKNVEFSYVDSSENQKGKNSIVEYSSMIYNNVNTYQMAFVLKDINKDIKLGLYIQFLDFNKLEVAQKVLQPMVSGIPKSFFIPSKKSLYHFLPNLEGTNEIHYFIRPKYSNSKMFVTFKTTQSYPENCYYSEQLTSDTAVPLINNIGMWSTKNSTYSTLQLLYVYCETDCAYDVVMSYDEDPIFMFPESNYTKYLGSNKRDIFVLPVFEYLSTFDEIKIDLTTISGNAKLTLYESLENLNNNIPLNYNYETINQRQSYSIINSVYTKASYYKKDLYVLIEGDEGSFYTLKYTADSLGKNVLDNNRIFTDTMKINENLEKTYTFKNERGDFYISVNTLSCKSKITINDEEQSEEKYNHLIKKTTKGNFVIQISIVNDNNICQNGFEEQIILYAYNGDYTDILINENNFISTSYIGSRINFVYLFNPNDNRDNSYNIEIERLSQGKLSFEYKLEKISFEKTQSQNTQKTSLSQTILSKKNNILNEDQILSICDNLDTNEICSLTMSFIPSDTKTENYFNFYLNNNNKNYIRPLTKETLISSINSNKAQYYYIDLNKNFDTEILLNSYGEDLEIKYDIVNDKSKVKVPFDTFGNGNSFNKIHINKNELTSCDKFCRAIIGIHMPKTEKESSTTYSINYLFINNNVQASGIILPLNYDSRYKFDDINMKEITFTSQIYDTSNIIVEFTNESPNINPELYATIEYSGKTGIVKSGQNINMDKIQGEIKIKIENSILGAIFRLKIASLGKQLSSFVYQILSSYSEKCSITSKESSCYYILDITPDIYYSSSVYLFVPESEDIYISIKDLDLGYGENINSDMNKYLTSTFNDFSFTSKGKMQRSNWCEYNIDKSKSLLVKLASFTGHKLDANLLVTYYNKPDVITLNNAEKRTFNIKQDENNEIKINIPKAPGNNIKYRINLHSIKGNGVFKILEQTYPLGLLANYKEDISIIIDSDNVNKYLTLIASNKYDENIINDFIFSVEYLVEEKNKIIYEIENEKINSYKFYTDNNLNNLYFYMKANYTSNNNKQTYKDINMNIKIYTKLDEFNIKTYIVNETLINNILKGTLNNIEGNTVGTITNYIKGGKGEYGSLSLSKFEMSSDSFNNYTKDNEQLYLYLIFTQKTPNQNKEVKIDLYSYDITNTKPLSRNELYIQHIPPKTLNYQFLLSKSDLYYSEDIIIEYSPPQSKKYDFGVMHSKNALNEIARMKSILRKEEMSDTGIKELYLNSREENLRYILFNIYSNSTNLEEKKDLFLFKYKHNDVGKDIYFENILEFNSTYLNKKLTFNIKAFNPRYKTGESIIIINGFKKSQVSSDMTAFSLLFSDIKPVFTRYITGTLKDKEEIDFELSGGEYVFSCVQVFEDNGREDYIGQKLVNINVSQEQKQTSTGNSIIEYIKNHIAATVIICVVIILFIALMINICRKERRGRVQITKIENDIHGVGELAPQ